MMQPEDEAPLRLVAFGLGLLAVAARGSVLKTDDLGIPIASAQISDWAREEAHVIAEAFMVEAQSLRPKGKS